MKVEFGFEWSLGHTSLVLRCHRSGGRAVQPSPHRVDADCLRCVADCGICVEGLQVVLAVIGLTMHLFLQCAAV